MDSFATNVQSDELPSRFDYDDALSCEAQALLPALPDIDTEHPLIRDLREAICDSIFLPCSMLPKCITTSKRKEKRAQSETTGADGGKDRYMSLSKILRAHNAKERELSDAAQEKIDREKSIDALAVYRLTNDTDAKEIPLTTEYDSDTRRLRLNVMRLLRDAMELDTGDKSAN